MAWLKMLKCFCLMLRSGLDSTPFPSCAVSSDLYEQMRHTDDYSICICIYIYVWIINEGRPHAKANPLHWWHHLGPQPILKADWRCWEMIEGMWRYVKMMLKMMLKYSWPWPSSFQAMTGTLLDLCLESPGALVRPRSPGGQQDFQLGN